MLHKYKSTNTVQGQAGLTRGLFATGMLPNLQRTKVQILVQKYKYWARRGQAGLTRGLFATGMLPNLLLLMYVLIYH
jgi:hypothetical protein